MNWADIDVHPDRRKLRQFAALLTAIGILFAAFARPAWIFVAVYGALSILVPRIAYPAYVALTVATFPIGWGVSRLLLGIVFYAVIMPIGLVQRLIRRDALHLREHDAPTYWRKAEASSDPASYLRQF